MLFYNVKGKTLSWQSGEEHDKSTDWYRYGVGLTPVAPADRGALSASATFIGWTTKPSGEEGMHGGYAAITSPELAELKNAGAFYPAGTEITVLGPADFYPVYSDYVSNIMTVFEGNERDELDDKTQRAAWAKLSLRLRLPRMAPVCTRCRCATWTTNLYLRTVRCPTATASWLVRKQGNRGCPA